MTLEHVIPDVGAFMEHGAARRWGKGTDTVAYSSSCPPRRARTRGHVRVLGHLLRALLLLHPGEPRCRACSGLRGFRGRPALAQATTTTSTWCSSATSRSPRATGQRAHRRRRTTSPWLSELVEARTWRPLRGRSASDKLESHRRRDHPLREEKGRRPVLWGSGSKGSLLPQQRSASEGRRWSTSWTSIPTSQGRYLMPSTGHPIVGPEFLKDYKRPDAVVVMNPIYRRGDRPHPRLHGSTRPRSLR